MSSLVHEHGFWLFGDPESVKAHHMFDGGLARALLHLFKRGSVLDIGCGTGEYVRFFRSRKVYAAGFDGNPNTPAISGGVCGVRDFSKSIDLGRTFDFVMSLEVGEHIPSQFEGEFLDNVVRHATQGIALSWSTPEIERGLGLGHVNCRTNDWVIAEMGKRGWQHLPETQKYLRRASRCYHFPFTLMFFGR